MTRLMLVGFPLFFSNHQRLKYTSIMGSPRKTTEQFVAEAKSIHGDKYDYSKVSYINNSTKVCIVCPKHGEFMQYPKDHINGNGCRKCPRKKRMGVCDVNGVNGVPSHNVWQGVIERCYFGNTSRSSSYNDCTICDEWLTYSNFKKWFEDPENGYQEGYHLDKDILVKGNRQYAPNKCCFVPNEINALLIKQKKRKSSLPIGVCQVKSGRFVARVNSGKPTHHIGTFNTPEDAFQAYKIAKEQYVKELAEKYFQEGKITEKVYDALMKYEVEITD